MKTPVFYPPPTHDFPPPPPFDSSFEILSSLIRRSLFPAIQCLSLSLLSLSLSSVDKSLPAVTMQTPLHYAGQAPVWPQGVDNVYSVLIIIIRGDGDIVLLVHVIDEQN